MIAIRSMHPQQGRTALVRFVLHRAGDRPVPEKRHGSDVLYPASAGRQKL
jgi:hypothetical protein